MYRLIKNRLKGRKKIKDERSASYVWSKLVNPIAYGVVPYHQHAWHPDMSYYDSLWQFREELFRWRKDDTKLVIWNEAVGWKKQSQQFFSPQETIDYILEKNLFSNNFKRFKSRWQIYLGTQVQHYFDIDIYDMNFDKFGHWENRGFDRRITIDCLL